MHKCFYFLWLHMNNKLMSLFILLLKLKNIIGKTKVSTPKDSTEVCISVPLKAQWFVSFVMFVVTSTACNDDSVHLNVHNVKRTQKRKLKAWAHRYRPTSLGGKDRTSWSIRSSAGNTVTHSPAYWRVTVMSNSLPSPLRKEWYVLFMLTFKRLALGSIL